MKKVLLFLLFVISSLQLSAAVGRGYVSVYKTDGTVDSIAVNGIYDISHSRIDLNGKEHADYVTMVVSTNDKEWKFLISEIKQVFLPNLELEPLTLSGGMNEQKKGPRRITFNGTFPKKNDDGITYKWEGIELDSIYIKLGDVEEPDTVYKAAMDSMTTDSLYAYFETVMVKKKQTPVYVYYPGRNAKAWNKVTIAKEQTQMYVDDPRHVATSGDCATAEAQPIDSLQNTYSFNLRHHSAFMAFLAHSDRLPSVKLKSVTMIADKPISGTFTFSDNGRIDLASVEEDKNDTIKLNTPFFFDSGWKHTPRDYYNNAQDSTAAYMVVAPQKDVNFKFIYNVVDTLSRIDTTFVRSFYLSEIKPNTFYTINVNVPDTLFSIVDLGLGDIKYAFRNVEAYFERGQVANYGGAFAYGESNTKNDYSPGWQNQNMRWGLINEEFTSNWDAAYQRWGGCWRLQQTFEADSLLKKCSFEWWEYNGVEGILITGPSGKRIFLPGNENCSRYWTVNRNYTTDDLYYYIPNSGGALGYYKIPALAMDKDRPTPFFSDKTEFYNPGFARGVLEYSNYIKSNTGYDGSLMLLRHKHEEEVTGTDRFAIVGMVRSARPWPSVNTSVQLQETGFIFGTDSATLYFDPSDEIRNKEWRDEDSLFIKTDWRPVDGNHLKLNGGSKSVGAYAGNEQNIRVELKGADFLGYLDKEKKYFVREYFRIYNTVTGEYDYYYASKATQIQGFFPHTDNIRWQVGDETATLNAHIVGVSAEVVGKVGFVVTDKLKNENEYEEPTIYNGDLWLSDNDGETERGDVRNNMTFSYTIPKSDLKHDRYYFVRGVFVSFSEENGKRDTTCLYAPEVKILHVLDTMDYQMSFKSANINVGAQYPEDRDSTYVWNNGGTVDPLITDIAGTEHDIVFRKWFGREGWCFTLPTVAQAQAMLDTLTFVTPNNKKRFDLDTKRVTGINDEKGYLPYTPGYYYDYANYWTSERTGTSGQANYVNYLGEVGQTNATSKLWVRPVLQTNCQTLDGEIMFISTDTVGRHYIDDENSVISFYGRQLGITPAMKAKYTNITRGFVLHDYKGGTLENLPCGDMPDTATPKDSIYNGLYIVPLPQAVRDTIRADKEYWYRAYIKVDDQVYYGRPKKIAPLTISIDSIGWEVHEKRATLYSFVDGVEFVNNRSDAIVGYIVGDTAYIDRNNCEKEYLYQKEQGWELKNTRENNDTHIKSPRYETVIDVPKDTIYWVRAFIEADGMVRYSEPRQFGLDYVDLGVKDSKGQTLLWANIDVGSAYPEDNPDYYAIGESFTKFAYTEKTYVDDTLKYVRENTGQDSHIDHQTTSVTKWINLTVPSTHDDNYVVKFRGAEHQKYNCEGPLYWKGYAGTKNDAAYVNWGNDNPKFTNTDKYIENTKYGNLFVEPDQDEWEALRDQCAWTTDVVFGVPGWRVTGTNGNSIFIPLKGEKRGGYNIKNHNLELTTDTAQFHSAAFLHVSDGYYTSSTNVANRDSVKTVSLNYSNKEFFDTPSIYDTWTLTWGEFYEGLQVRPIARYNLRLTKGADKLRDDTLAYLSTDTCYMLNYRTAVALQGSYRINYPMAANKVGFVVGNSHDVTVTNSPLINHEATLKNNSQYFLVLDHKDGLESDKTYYYRFYLKVGDTYYYADADTFHLAQQVTGAETRWQMYGNQAHVTGTVQGILKNEAQSAGFKAGIIISKNRDLKATDNDLSANYDMTSTLNDYDGSKGGPISHDFTLPEEAIYYFRTYAYYNGIYHYGDVNTFGYELLDLGLPSGKKWASINTGGNSPLNGRSTAPTYDYHGVNSQTNMPYANNGNGSGGRNDVSHNLWNNVYRQPYTYEAQELIDNCTWELDTLYGCAGMTGTGPNGKKIFIRRNVKYYQFEDNYTDLSINQNYVRISNNSSKPSIGYLYEHTHGCRGVDFERAIWESNATLPNSGQDNILIRTDDAIVHNRVDYVSFFGSLLGTTQRRWNSTSYNVPNIEYAGFVVGSDTLTTHAEGTGGMYFKYDFPHHDVKKDSIYWYDRQNINLFKVDSTYWVRAYVKIDGSYYYGRSIKFVRQPNIITGDVEWQVGDQTAVLHGEVIGFNADYTMPDVTSTELQDMEELTKNARMGLIVGLKHDLVAADTLTDAHAKLYYYTVNGEPRAINDVFQVTVPYEKDTTYYYRAFIYYNGEYVYGKTGRFGLEFVDLGFNKGMYWASINVGSRYAEDNSSQYAWGELDPRSVFRFEDYIYYYSTGDDEYNNLGNEIKGSRYDVAHDRWDYTWDEAGYGGRGALWTMPSEDDLQMLVDSCEWRDSVSYKYVPNSNGGYYADVAGYKVTSRKNGNWIFITKNDRVPEWTMSGYHSGLYGPWERTPLWTSSRAPRDRNAFGMQGGTTNRLMKYHYRYHGHYVRPMAYINVVLDSGHKLSLTTERTSWVAGVDNASIYGCILGLNDNVKATYGFLVGRSAENLIVGASGVETYTVATNSNVNGLFSKNFSTIDNNRMYYYRVFAKVGNQYFYGNIKEFGIVMVDLGLTSGTKWANVNMGSWRIKDHGDFYGWGETTTKDIFTEVGYKYFDNMSQQYRDLSTNISANDTTDVANKFLKGLWRMPGDAEWDELRTECTWTPEVVGHIPGFRVTGRNGNNIFLPSNYYTIDERDANYDYSTNEEGSQNLNHDDEVTHLGYYWSSNRAADFRQAREFTFNTNGSGSISGTLDNNRWRGNSIRAVARPFNSTVPFYFRTESTDWRYQKDSINFYSAVLELPAGYETGFLIGTSAEMTKDNAIYSITAKQVKDGSGNYSGFIENSKLDTPLAEETVYYYRAYVKDGNNNYTYADSKQFGLKTVDMGVGGLQWANINVDAASPEEMGLHGVLSGKYADADPAYVEFGSLWRIPTDAEKQLLVDSCSWEQVSLYGTRIWKVSNKTDATKFIYMTSNDPSSWGYRAMTKSNLTFEDEEKVFLRTDSTNWRAGYGGSTLFATLVGKSSLIDDITERGFVVGTTENVTHDTNLQQSTSASSEQISKSNFEAEITTLPVGTFFYRAYVQYKGKYYYAENALPVGIEFVDLGLPSGVTWANVNIGSTTSSDTGDKYAWGETSIKNEYTLDNYIHHTSDGYTDIGADISSSMTYDAATIKISGSRMPSQADIQELLSNCSWTSETINGVAGYRVTSTNGNSIFLPDGSFWSSTQNTANNSQAFELQTSQSATPLHNVIADTRWIGRMIRPVSALVTTTDPTIVTTSTAQLNGYVNIADYTGAEVGFELSRSSTMADAEQKNVSIAANGPYNTVVDNLVEGNMYYYRAYATVGGVTYRGAIKNFSTKSSAGLKAIDLGLSVKWGDRNVGAEMPENDGNYYAWGDTITQRNYTAVTYRHATGNNTNAIYHDISMNISATEWDIANKKYNGCWRMPTQTEIAELMSNCSWTWATKEGVPGYWVENSVSHQNIFLPASGYRDNTDLMQDNTNGYYWSAVPNGSVNARQAMALTFNSTSKSVTPLIRYDGLIVRPVYDSNGKLGEQDIFIRTDSVSYNADRTEYQLYGMMLGLNSAEDGLTQGFVIGTTTDVTTANTVISGLSQAAVANGSYNIILSDEQLHTLTIGDVYYVRAYVTNGTETKYGSAIEMNDYTFFTDSVKWGLGNAGKLYGHVKGVKPANGLEVGFFYSTNSDMSNSKSIVGSFEPTKETVFTGQIDTIKVATYYWQAYTKYDGVIHRGAVKSFGAKLVDLGLTSGVKWVDMNLGSDDEENAGDGYRWGEIVPDRDDTYSVSSGFEYIGGTEYDAVHTRLGSSYRIASISNIEELLNECTWAFDVNGYRVTGKNGNSIFLPVGDYWSSQKGTNGDGSNATALSIDNTNTKTEKLISRDSLLLLRPTLNPKADVQGEGGNAGSGTIGGGEGDDDEVIGGDD